MPCSSASPSEVVAPFGSPSTQTQPAPPEPSRPPTTLYQTWKTLTLPPKYQANWDRWDRWASKHHITHVLLDDRGLRALVAKHYPRYLNFYDRTVTENIERVDFSRMVMMAIGGIYADLDTFPSEKNDVMDYVALNKIVLGREPKEHTRVLYLRELVICNAFMISPSGPENKKFWERLIAYVVQHYEPHYRPVENTGPMALTTAYEEHPEWFSEANVLITDPCVFFPMVANGKVSRECRGYDDSFVVHEWTNSWSFKIWTDPIWKNKRHQVYLIAIFVGVAIIIWARGRAR